MTEIDKTTIAVMVAPWFLATFLTIGLVWVVKMVNRGMGRDKISNWLCCIATVFLGGGFGCLSVWTTGDLVSDMTGYHVGGAKAYVMYSLLSGIGAPLAYGLIMWALRKRGWMRLYEFLRVRHIPGVDYTNDKSDLTRMPKPPGQPLDYEKTRVLTPDEIADITGSHASDEDPKK